MASIALTLTVVGIFSVLNFTVKSRVTEFGVRLALGATTEQPMEGTMPAPEVSLKRPPAAI
jgi:hypothetical protein